MKAKNLSGCAPGGKRTKLAEALPLATPYVVQIFPIYACNFKCNYCIFQYPPKKRGFISDEFSMRLSKFAGYIDGMCDFPDKIKVLRFVGIGEPLLHPYIGAMIQYAKMWGVTEKVEIITNGFLLGICTSDVLLKSGLDRLVVSIQGTSAEKYKETAGADIDFKRFVRQLKYFYKNKGDCEMYIKIIDSALDGPEDEKKFYKLFGDICDSIAIEHTVPIHSCIDYGKLLKNKKMTLTQFGLPAKAIKVCPQPFFHLQINPDGKVVPCYAFEYPGIMGDANKESIVDIWNGKKFNQFRRKLLNQEKPSCLKCELIKHRLFPEDVLDNDIERLKEMYK